jgi:hypothetical protein
MGLIALVTFLLVTYAVNLLGPARPPWQDVAWFALSAWLLPVWAWWVDRHRELRPA